MSGEIQRDVAMPNDVGEWGDKDVRGMYSGPSMIAGEMVDFDKLPRFGADGPTTLDATEDVLCRERADRVPEADDPRSGT